MSEFIFGFGIWSKYQYINDGAMTSELMWTVAGVQYTYNSLILAIAACYHHLEGKTKIISFVKRSNL